MRRPHVVGIDLLRFVAACLVMVFHLETYYLLSHDNDAFALLHLRYLAAYAPDFAKYGFVGVEIFFVISGYVISFSVEGRTRAHYLRTRFLRLFPTVWVCASLCLVLAILSRQDHTRTLLIFWARSLVIFPQGPWINAAYWTLPIEIAFYGFMLIAAGDVARRQALALAIGTASIVFWAGFLICQSLPQLYSSHGLAMYLTRSRALDLLLVHHGIYFALGMLLHNPVRRKLMIVFCGLILCAAYIQITVESQRFGGLVGIFIAPWYSYALWLAGMAYLVAAIRCNAALVAALGQRGVNLFKEIGALTYPLYLIHTITAWAVAYGLMRLGVRPIIAWSTGPFVAIALAAVIARWIEPWARRLTGQAIDHGWRRLSRLRVPAA